MYRILIIIFVLALSQNLTFPQSIGEILSDLNSDDPSVILNATNLVIVNEIEEAIPIILNRYDDMPAIIKQDFLIILTKFQEPSAESRIFEFIASADSYTEEEYPLDPLVTQVNATRLLFYLSNFSTYNYVFALLDRDSIKNSTDLTTYLLEQILQNVPSGEVTAKNYLEAIWSQSDNDHVRYVAMTVLIQKYGTQYLTNLLISFENDTYLPIKIKSFEYLSLFSYPNLHELLLSRLPQEEFKQLRINISDTLLTIFGVPTDLKAVVDYHPTEPDETIKSLMENTIQEFIPPYHDMPAISMMDSLDIYVDQLSEFGWILDPVTYAEFKNLTEKLSNSYIAQDYITVCDNLNRVIALADEKLQSELITIYAYKFLHYQSNYTLAKMEEEIGACQ